MIKVDITIYIESAVTEQEIAKTIEEAVAMELIKIPGSKIIKL